MRPEISTTAYQFSHGHGPRGRGGWAFALGDENVNPLLWVNGTYAEAKKAAIQKARETGVTFINVMP